MLRSTIIAAVVALAVSLAVNLGPGLLSASGPARTTSLASVLDWTPIASLIGNARTGSLAAAGAETVFCEPELASFTEQYAVKEDDLTLLAGDDRLTETTILTPTRTGSYNLSEAPDLFAGFFAQRGSFESDLTGKVAHIEVLTSFMLEGDPGERRSLSDTLKLGRGPTFGVFHVEYEGGGSLTGEWTGQSDGKGLMQGCFFVPPALVGGVRQGGYGTYRQTFAQNDTSIVTWTFDAVMKPAD